MANSADRLRELVGLARADDLAPVQETSTRPFDDATAHNVADDTLKNQDSLLSGLFHELHDCRTELSIVKQEYEQTVSEIRQLYDELKLQFSRSQPAGTVTGIVAASSKDSDACPNCARMIDENRRLTDQCAIATTKVRESILLVEQAVAEKEALEWRYSHTQLDVERATETLNGDIDALRTSNANMRAELSATNAKLEDLSHAESRAKQQLYKAEAECATLLRQLEASKDQTRNAEKSLTHRLADIQLQLNSTTDAKLSAIEELRQFRQKLASSTALDERKIDILERQLASTKTVHTELIDENRSLRAEVARARDKCELLDRELWQAKQQAERATYEREEGLVLSRDASTVQALKSAETQWEKGRAYLEAQLLSQTLLVEKLLGHCKSLTDKLETVAKEAAKKRRQRERHQ